MKCWSIYNERRYARMPEFNEYMEAAREAFPEPFDHLDGDEDCERDLEELCWNFFMRGLELELGPEPE